MPSVEPEYALESHYLFIRDGDERRRTVLKHHKLDFGVMEIDIRSQSRVGKGLDDFTEAISISRGTRGTYVWRGPGIL